MVETITAEKLKEKIENKEDFRLIEVLLPGLFDEWHIPGAINIPADDNREIIFFNAEANSIGGLKIRPSYYWRRSSWTSFGSSCGSFWCKSSIN
ncbi:MAG: hypothetical protein KAI62_06120 [Actinomycetia bacterium]|nr:hypothetical protein [Actinomycetes bacterium]